MAPLLMIGGALGALFTPVLPSMSTGAWALVGMTAVFSGAIGCPLTAAVLSLELTHNYGLLLPVLAGSVVAHAFTVLFQKRSILTERISRRGYHLSREYGVDPLETVRVAETMRTRTVVLPAGMSAEDARAWLEHGRDKNSQRGQRLYPVVDEAGRLTGVMTRSDLAALAKSGAPRQPVSPAEPVVAYPDEMLRAAAERMATRHVYVLPVVERGTGKVVGLLNAENVLEGRVRTYDRENKQVRVRQPFRTQAATKAIGETV
jgi:chloride channel protein, CIC family